MTAPLRMNVLVTGATGFIGSVLTRKLVERGAEVRILRRETSQLDLLGEVAHHVEHALGDVTAPETLRPAFRGIEQVYHAAAYIGTGGRQERARMHQINVAGTGHVINAALLEGVARMVHTSSMAAFGRPDREDILIDESTPWVASRANTAYAQSKHEAELEVHRGIAEGLDIVLVNPALVFGVGRPGENTRQMVDRVRQGKLPAVPVGGTNVVDVEDVAEGHLLAMERGVPGERYFLGSENLSWQAIVHTLAEAFEVKAPQRALPPGLALALGSIAEAVAALTRTRPLFTRTLARQAARFYRYDNTKAIRDLGCTFRPFEATADRLAATLADDAARGTPHQKP